MKAETCPKCHQRRTTMDNNTIYAIYDNVAKAIVGMLTMHKHEASAIRMYADIASMPDSQLNKHPQDFDLVRLGYLRDHQLLDPAFAVILKGSVYAATKPRLINEPEPEGGTI